jgi:hypothetical protein
MKTETDKETLIAYDRFSDAVEKFKTHRKRKGSIASFSRTRTCEDIRAYLNIHELVGAGINKGILDDDVCYFFWSGEMAHACKDVGPLIEFIQTRPGEKYSYVELVELNSRWLKRSEREDRFD